MPKISEYTQPISLYKWLIVICTHSIGQISFQYYLQKCSFLKKQVKSPLKEHNGVLNIQNSTNNHSIALAKYLLDLLLRIDLELFIYQLI
jgi:hypothetical protein